MEKWHKHIARQARHASKEYRQSGRFFNKAAKFDETIRLAPKHDETINQLFEAVGLNRGYKIGAKKRTFQTLLSNLLYHWVDAKRNKCPTVVSLNRNYWTGFSSVSYPIIKQIKTLKEHGFIEWKKGYHFKDKKENRMTRIWPTKKLLGYQASSERTYVPARLVVLRELDSDKPKKHKPTARSRKREKELKEINKVNNNAEIWHPEEGHLDIYYQSIFKGNFSLYGRLHTLEPANVQGLPKEERRRLSINGQPAAELDFSALHPHLVYAEEGIQYNGDPYLAGGIDPVFREFHKIMFMAILNTDSKTKIFKAVNNWFYENPKERQKLVDAKIIPHHIWIKPGKDRSKWVRQKAPTKKYVMPLIDEFMGAHPKIKNHFLAGKKHGLRVMFKDSEIALRVTKHFTDKGCPCLSVHDSFIVPKSKEPELKQVMAETYSKVTGGYRCPVKREYEPMELTEDTMIGLKTVWRKVS